MEWWMNNVTNHVDVDATGQLGFLLPGRDKIPARRPTPISTSYQTTSPLYL